MTAQSFLECYKKVLQKYWKYLHPLPEEYVIDCEFAIVDYDYYFNRKLLIKPKWQVIPRLKYYASVFGKILHGQIEKSR